MKIFFSHQSKDKPLVREFKNKLPGFLDTWLDEEKLIWGDDYPDKLEKIIKSKVDFLFIFLDDDALSSEWVEKELKWAIKRERELNRTFILPILLPGVSSESLPAEFSDRLSLRLNDFHVDSVDELAKKAILNLFQLVVESFSDATEDRNIIPYYGQGSPGRLTDDEIKILMALNKAMNDSEINEDAEIKYISILAISKSIDIQISKVDYLLRKLEDAGYVFVIPERNLTVISKRGIGYLVKNNIL